MLPNTFAKLLSLCPRVRSTLLLAGMWTVASAWPLAACSAVQQQANPGATCFGQVADIDGKSIEAATVTLHHGGSKDRITTTDAAGNFSFQALPLGTYQLTATRSGLFSPPTSVTLSGAPSQPIQIRLEPAPGPALPTSSPAAASAIAFTDEPNFTVAGVTDWTAVGGHGSDATLRASEDLARETLTLKPGAANGNAPGPMNPGAVDGQEQTLRHAALTSPQSYAANHALGQFYLDLRHFQQAVPFLQAASGLHGALPEDEFALALACQGIGDLPQARQHIDRALAGRQSAQFHLLAGELNERLGDPLAAVQHEERAAQMDPSEQNYFVWGSELLLHRAIWQAAQVFANGAKAHPASARIRTGWGAALFAAARYDGAAQQLCDASDLAPADVQPYLFLGRAVVSSPQDLPCAQGRLQRFLQLRPADPQANYFNAMLLLRQSPAPDLARATALLQKAVALDPKHAEAYLQLGILAFGRHNYPEAIDLYTRAIAADPQQAEAHYRLGVAYDRTARSEQARSEFQLHDQIAAAQAEEVERQRRQLKQFLVVLQDKPAPSQAP